MRVWDEGWEGKGRGGREREGGKEREGRRGREGEGGKEREGRGGKGRLTYLLVSAPALEHEGKRLGAVEVASTHANKGKGKRKGKGKGKRKGKGKGKEEGGSEKRRMGVRCARARGKEAHLTSTPSAVPVRVPWARANEKGVRKEEGCGSVFPFVHLGKKKGKEREGKGWEGREGKGKEGREGRVRLACYPLR